MEAVDVDVLILNFNGQALLAECLPSILCAAANSRHRCRVAVVDNGSSDDSLEFLERNYPNVPVLQFPNAGLASFNAAMRSCTGNVALLLNNDIKLAENSVDPLVEPLLSQAEGEERVFLTAPRSYLFDESTHEGFKTSVRWRYGLVQATALFDGCEKVAAVPSATASAGAALTVDRELFLKIGGFDPLYFPGRIEDLDFCYRGFLAGHRAVYVPESIVFHRGAGSFEPAFGAAGCRRLALRNTLLFQWKCLRLPRHRALTALGTLIRSVRDVVRAPMLPKPQRFKFLQARQEAKSLWNSYV